MGAGGDVVNVCLACVAWSVDVLPAWRTRVSGNEYDMSGVKPAFPGVGERCWATQVVDNLREVIDAGGGCRNRTGVDGFAGSCSFSQIKKLRRFDTRIDTAARCTCLSARDDAWNGVAAMPAIDSEIALGC